MIYYIVATHNLAVYKEYLEPYLTKINANCRIVTNQIPEIEESIFVKYNAGIKSLLSELKDDDVVCFAHEDIKLIDSNFEEKVKIVFDQKHDVGLLGVIGTSELPESIAWWQSKQEKMRGHIIQEYETGGARHLVKGNIGYFDDLVCVDGLCFFIRGKLLKEGLLFDESYKAYHLYDLDVCIQVLEKGHKVAVADILVQHKSIGQIKDKDVWDYNKNVFIDKYSKYGFPIIPFNIKNKKSNIITINI